MYSCVNQCCDIFYSHRIYLSVILFFNQFIHSPYQLFSHFFILIKTVLRISPTIDSSGWFSFYSAHRGSNSVTDISTVRSIPSLPYYFRSTERRSWCHVYPRNIKFKTFSHKAIRILSIQLFSYFLKKKIYFWFEIIPFKDIRQRFVNSVGYEFSYNNEVAVTWKRQQI